VLEHEVIKNLRVSGGYYHRKFYNLAITDNLTFSPSDYEAFTFVAPAGTPGGVAGQTITAYTLPANQLDCNTAAKPLGSAGCKVGGPTNNFRTFSAGNFGPKNSTIYNGFEATFNARFRNKLIGFGGVTTEKTQTNTCDEPDSPNTARFCDAPRKYRTTIKASLAYNLPWDSQVSASFLGRPGPSVRADYTVNSTIAGRTLCSTTTCTNVTTTVNLIAPDTVVLERQNTLDLRGSKAFKFNRYRASLFVDVFNAFNSGTVTSVNQAFSPTTTTWNTPQTILQGAYLRFGTQWTF
jgi:hypothetical protein